MQRTIRLFGNDYIGSSRYVSGEEGADNFPRMLRDVGADQFLPSDLCPAQVHWFPPRIGRLLQMFEIGQSWIMDFLVASSTKMWRENIIHYQAGDYC